MGRLLSVLKASVANFGAKMGSMLKGIPGVGKLMEGLDNLRTNLMDSYEWCMEQADAAWDFTRDAAVHVSQDVVNGARKLGLEMNLGVREGLGFSGRVLFNNPISNMGKNLIRTLTGDNRPRIVKEADRSAKQGADKELKAAKAANPAELAAVKAAYIKNDPELVERYVGAESVTDRNEIKKQMSPKCQAWISELKGTELWSLKGKSSVEIAAHMAGDKSILGVEKCADYYVAAKPADVAPKLEAPKDKTVGERRAERTAKKLAKRPGAANVVTPDVAGAVPEQAAEVPSSAQHEVMQFFGPKVAKPEEVSEYSQSSLPAYRPPVPRKAG